MKKFCLFLNDLVSRHGQGTLADTIGVDDSALSRFRSGQGSLPLLAIEKLLDADDVVIIPKEQMKRLEDALETISDLWKQERKSKTTPPITDRRS